MNLTAEETQKLEEIFTNDPADELDEGDLDSVAGGYGMSIPFDIHDLIEQMIQQS